MGLIASGSLVSGIDPAGFGLPAGTAIRFERPDPGLSTLVAAYAVLDSDTAIWKGPGSWMLPGWAQIWIVLTEETVTVRTRKRQPVPLGQAMVAGPTSCAMPVTSNGGVSVVIELTPAGWARWFTPSAQTLRDRIVPLDDLWPPPRVSELVARLHASDREGAVKQLLDTFLLDHLPPPKREEPTLTALATLIARNPAPTVAEVEEALGLSSGALLRLGNRFFGYPVKVLLRRTRFLRALSDMMLADTPIDFRVIPPGYHDVPHFLRDAKTFLGLTPRQFLALPMPYLRAALRARRAVIGAPLPELDRAQDARFSAQISDTEARSRRAA